MSLAELKAQGEKPIRVIDWTVSYSKLQVTCPNCGKLGVSMPTSCGLKPDKEVICHKAEVYSIAGEDRIYEPAYIVEKCEIV